MASNGTCIDPQTTTSTLQACDTASLQLQVNDHDTTRPLWGLLREEGIEAEMSHENIERWSPDGHQDQEGPIRVPAEF